MNKQNDNNGNGNGNSTHHNRKKNLNTIVPFVKSINIEMEMERSRRSRRVVHEWENNIEAYWMNDRKGQTWGKNLINSEKFCAHIFVAFAIWKLRSRSKRKEKCVYMVSSVCSGDFLLEICERAQSTLNTHRLSHHKRWGVASSSMLYAIFVSKCMHTWVCVLVLSILA